MKKLLAGLTVICAVTALVGCSNSSESGDKFTLRIAQGSPGEEVAKVWEQVKDKYQEKYPNVKVELIIQDTDMYQTIGLPNLLNGKNAPDLYFEWPGERLKTRVKDGFAADLTEALKQDGLKDMFDAGDFKGMAIDGKTYMIPTASDVTNVMWYNKKMFKDLALEAPKTWDEFMAVCAKLKAAKITPIASGNKDLWPAGNWNAHVLSRVVGEQAYADAMELKIPFNSPDFVKGMNAMKQLWDNKYINDSVNGINDTEGSVLFFNGEAAMYPIGSWLVAMAEDAKPDFEYGYFNLPSIAGGKGDQNSVLGVMNGFVVNKKSAHFQAAVDFMKMYSAPEFSALLNEAGQTPIAKGGVDPKDVNPISQSLITMLKQSKTMVSPPDTGYNIEVATALNTATSAVLGGVSTPEKALEELDKKVAALKK